MRDVSAPDAQIQALLDERGILDTLNRYCRALDEGIAAEWEAIFTDDAVFDTILPDGQVWAHLTTRDEFRAFLAAYPRQPATAPKHVMVNPVIELDGDEASVRATFLYLNQSPGAAPELSAWGHYRDRLRKVDGRWRFSSRWCETEAKAD